MHRFVLVSVLLTFAIFTKATPACAATNKFVESAGTDIAIAMPVIATGISLFHDEDWDGVAELGASTLASVGIAYGLSHVVHEERPDHSDFHSFPSDTAALAYSSSDYLWARYGWRYGLPAYAAAMFVGYSRVDAKKHHWYDVMASSALPSFFENAAGRLADIGRLPGKHIFSS